MAKEDISVVSVVNVSIVNSALRYRERCCVWMFDNYSANQRVSVNAVSGSLSKTCKDSYFQCCQIGSNKFDYIINKKSVVVLQAMIMSDKYVMFEVITKEDFEKLNNK